MRISMQLVTVFISLVLCGSAAPVWTIIPEIPPRALIGVSTAIV